jgi:hypothetical protein
VLKAVLVVVTGAQAFVPTAHLRRCGRVADATGSSAELCTNLGHRTKPTTVPRKRNVVNQLSMVASVTKSSVAKQRAALDASWLRQEKAHPTVPEKAGGQNHMEPEAGGEYFLSERGQVRPRIYRCGICGQPKLGHVCPGPPQTKAPTRGKASCFLGPSRHSFPVEDDDQPAVQQLIGTGSEFEDFWKEEAKTEHRDARDALRRPAVSVYNAWALDGRDRVMEITHSAAFQEAWEFVAENRLTELHEFTVIDAGCGNGWAARQVGLWFRVSGFGLGL